MSKTAPHCPRHCDDYIDDETAPPVLRKFLEWARSPAHGMTQPQPWPTLYATYADVCVRVTMASRFGWVGITVNHGRDVGYDYCVHIESLSNFSETAF